jgi:hypothetical protein
MNVLLVAPRFNLEGDFEVSVHNVINCQGLYFKQIAMVILKKMDAIANTSVHFKSQF